MEWTFDNEITSEEALREILGHPEDKVMQKTIDHIDENCRNFIENSPFITIATANGNGNLDVSPKGDPPGFVKILTEKLLAIPDRPGNRRADTFTNILQNRNIGLIFLIPGIKETLRVNGLAKIVTDQKVLEPLTVNGKQPSLAIIVEVKEAFMHCAKCIIRSKLWTNIDESRNSAVPSLAKSLVDHAKLDITYQEMDEMIKDDEKTGLY